MPAHAIQRRDFLVIIPTGKMGAAMIQFEQKLGKILEGSKRFGLSLLLGLGVAGAANAQRNPNIPVIPDITCQSNPAIFNTGIDGTNGFTNASAPLPTGGTNVDAHWDYSFSNNVYTSINSGFDPQSVTDWTPAAVYFYGSPWAPSPYGNAQWLGTFNFGSGTVFYRYQFNLSNQSDVDNFRLNFNYYVDDRLQQVFVNGVQQFTDMTGPNGNGVDTVNYGTLNSPSTLLLNKSWKMGLNTIIVQTFNYARPTGWLVQSPGTALCSSALSVTKSSQKSATDITPVTTAVAANSTVYYGVNVTNNGVTDLTGVTLSDPLPSGITGYSWACSVPSPSSNSSCPTPSNGAGPLNGLALPTIPSGGQLRFLITATTASSSLPPVITNTATVTPPTGSDPAICKLPDGSNGCTASASISTAPYVSITKTAVSSGPFHAGDTVSYDLTVANEGSAPLGGVTVTDTLPAGLTNGQWSCSVPSGSFASCPTPATGSLTGGAVGPSAGLSIPGQSKLVYRVTATVASPVATASSVTNTASVTSSSSGAQCYNNATASPLANCSSTATVSLLPQMQVALNKTASPSGTLFGGQTLTYTVTVNNTGSVATSGTVNDPLPAGLTLVNWMCAATAPATCPNASGTTALNETIAATNLPAGGLLTYTIAATVNMPPPASITNVAAWAPDDTAHTTCTVPTAAQVTGAPCSAQVISTASGAAVLDISNTVSPTSAAPGAAVLYKIVASNQAGATVSAANITTDAPANITLGNWTCTASGGATCPAPSGTGAISQTAPTLPAGATLTYELKGTVSTSATDGSSIALKASLSTSTATATCTGGAATPCVKDAALSIAVVPVVPTANATPVPVNAWWMLMALATLMLGAAGAVQYRAQVRAARSRS